jgi:hypothetical protein
LGYQEQNTSYAGVYKVGINANNLPYYQSCDRSDKPMHGDYTAYGLVEKTVYHPVDSRGQLELKKGLDLLLEGVVGSPGDRNPCRI